MRESKREPRAITARGRRALAFLLSFVMVTSGVPMQAVAEVGDAASKDVAAQTAEESTSGQAAEQVDSDLGVTDEGQESAAAQSDEATEGLVNAPPEELSAEETVGTEQEPADAQQSGDEATSAEDQTNTEQQSFPEFSETVDVDGMQVRVTAPEGAYPASSKLDISGLPADQEKNMAAAVDAVRDAKREVAASYMIRVAIRDKENNEIAPMEGFTNAIAFLAQDYASDEYDVQVYTVSDDEESGVIQLDTMQDGGFTVVTPADAVVYCVQFTREAKEEAAQDSNKTPAEKEDPAATETDKMPAFAQQANLDGVQISVTADEGVFPEGARLDAKTVSAAAERKASNAVDEVRNTDQEVAASYVFDIKILDKNGNEIQPADDATVNVSFATAEVAKQELTTEVFHIDDETGVAEPLDVKEAGTTAKVVVDGFSIYVINFAADGTTVVSPTFATYEFYASENESVPVRSQKVKAGDDLYEPSTPTAPTGKKFVGWYVGNEKLNFTGEGKLNLTTLHVSTNGVVRVNAHYDTYRYVTFYDQDDNVFTRMSVVDGGTIAQSALPTFTPKLSTQTLVGWSTTKGGTTAATFPLTNIQADANYYPIIAQSHVLTFDANRLPNMKENASTGTKLLTVSYTPPQMIAPDGTTTEPSDPTCESSTYTFGGWYTNPECTTRFTFGQALSQDTTVYAKWTEGQAKYKVVVWKENIGVFYDDASRNTLTPSNYDYYRTYERTANVMDTVSLSSNDEAYDVETGYELAQSGNNVYGKPGSAKVMPDGSTVLNVYWNRQTVTSTFHKPTGYYLNDTDPVYYTNWVEDYTITGLYGQSFAMYKDTGNSKYANYDWPKKVTGRTLGTKKSGGYTYYGLTDRTSMRAYFNDSLSDKYYTDPYASTPAGNMYYVLQKADGSWPMPSEVSNPDSSNGSVIHAKTNSSGNATIYNSFANFNVVGYSQGSYKSTSTGRTPISDGGSVALNTQTLYLYNERIAYNVEFYNKNGQKNTSLSGSRLYGSSLADCANYALDNTNTERFVGWATNSGETSIDKAVDFSKLTVPDYTLAFYPIYATDQVNVKLKLAGTDADAAEVTLSDQQSKDFWPNVNTTIDMTLMNHATRPGYELDGWYTQDGVRWAESNLLAPDFCTKGANGQPKLNEPDAGYSSAYYTITLTARWHPVAQAQVVYTGDGATGIIDSDIYNLNGDVKVSPTHPTYGNKTFIGWRDLNGNMHRPGDTFTFDSKTLLNNEDKLELTAVYTAKDNPKTKVTYHANYSGSSATSSSDALEWNDALVLPSDTFTRNGYRINGWSTTAGATSPNTGFETGKTVGVSAMGATIDASTNTATIDLYATWEEAATLTFAPNNNAYGSVDKTSILVGKYTTDSVTVVATPADGYHLVNWTKDGTEVGTATTLTLTKPAGGWTNANYVAVFHKHEWSWAAGGNKVVATCRNSDDAHKGDTTVTLTLNVEDVTYLTPVSASVSNKSGMEETGTTVGEITFVSRGDTTYAESTTAPQLVGTYTAKVTVTENGHTYTAAKDFTIKPKEPSDTEKLTFDLANDTQTYDGNEHKPRVTNVKLGDIALEEGRGYRVEYVDNVDAGTATAKVILMGNFSGDDSKPFTINKADISPTIDVAPKAYDGNPVVPTISNNASNGRVTFYSYEKRNADGSWSTYSGTPTDAGTYRVTATIEETDNYNGATTNTKEFTISKANPTVTAPEPEPGLTYNKQPQALVKAGSTTGGTMQYSLDGTTWSTDVPKATDKGTYTVHYRVVGDENYNGVDAKSFQVEIRPRELTKDVDYDFETGVTLSPTEFTYNGQSQKPTVTVKLKDGTVLTEGVDFTMTYSSDTTNVGEKDATVNFTGNYGGTVVDKTYKINPKPLTQSDVTFTGNTFTYDGGEHGPAIVVTDGTVTLTKGKDYLVQNGTATDVNPAGSPYTVTVTGMGNYTGTVTGTYSINKYAIDPTKLTDAQKPTAKTLTYNGADQALVDAPTSVPAGYTMQYSLDGTNWSAELPKGKDAGTYNVHVKYKGDDNHADVLLGSAIPVTIGKKVVTITPQAGQTKVFDTSDPATFTYEQDGVVSGDTLNGKLKRAAGEGVGTYAFDISEFTATGANPNYDVKLAASAPTFSITKADQAAPATPILTATPNSVTVTNGKKGVTYTLYDKDGNPVAGKVTTPNADGSFTLSGLNPAEQYTVKAQIAADDNHNASKVSEASITTPKEGQSAPTPSLKNGASSVTATDGIIGNVDGTMEYSTNGGETWVPVPDGNTEIGGLAAGEVLVRRKGDGTKDPSPVAKVMVTFKLTGKVTWNYSYTYVDPDSGKEKTVTVDDTPEQRSKYARVELYNGANPIAGKSKVVDVSASASGATAETTYDFDDLPTADDAGNRINYHAEVTPLMSAGDTAAATGYSVNYIDAMHLQAEISFGQECFDAPWKVTVNSIDAPNGAKPDAVFVKVLYGTTAAGVDGGTYDGYDIIVQQSAGNGSTCTLVQQQDGSYVATGSFPVWKWQPGQTGEARKSYYHRILVTGYIANGTFFSLDNVISPKADAMVYTGSAASRTMEVTISEISVPSVEFDPNGGTIQNGYIVVPKGGTVTAAQINAKVPVWEGHTFDAWYTEPKGGSKQSAGITNIQGKQTLYAHWKMVIDPTKNAPTAKDLTYNSQAQELVNAPSELPAGCKKIQYSLDGTNWTDDLPKAVDAGTYTVKVRYVGDGAHADADGADIKVTIKPKPLTSEDVVATGMGTSLIYSGTAQGPTVSVKDGTTTLAEGTSTEPKDYVLSNTTATTAGSYAVTVTGQGNYTGSVQVPYTIAPYELGASDRLEIGNVTNYVYNGTDQRPSNVTVSLNGTALREGADFEIAYPAESVNAGNYEITVTLKNNYKGTAKKGYKITPKPLTADMVVDAPNTFVFSGQPQGPAITIKDGTTTLTKDADYLLTGETAVGVGDGYKAVVTGTGNYMGRVEKPFSITPYVLGEDDKVEIIFDGGDGSDEFTYNRADQRPDASKISVKITKADGTEVTLGADALNVKYLKADGTQITTDNGSTDAGTYQVQVELKSTSGYSGSAARGYVINPKPITAADVQFDGPEGFEYTYATQTGGDGMPQGPNETVTSLLSTSTNPTTLVKNQDYTVADAPKYDAGSYTMLVKGTGNFCGEVTKPYTIRKAQTKESDLTDANKPTVNKTDGKDGLVYNADEQVLVSNPTTMPKGYVEVLYSTDGGTTWTTEPKGTDVGVYTVQVKYVGDKNHEDFTIDPLTAKIVKRPVTITGESATKTYNGKVQKLESFSANVSTGAGDNEGFANSDHHESNLSYLASGTAKGEYEGAFTPTAATAVKIVDGTGTDVSGNYDVTLLAGKLTITATAVTDDGTIDEKGTGTSDGNTVVEVEGNQGDDAPTYDAQPHKPVVVDKQVTDENGNPKTLEEGTDYDVTYYKASDIDSDGNPVAGATSVTPEEAGEKVAVVTLKGNYSGTIKVRVDVKKRPVTFTGQTAERTYTGKEQEITGITVSTGENQGLVSGHTHNLTYSAKGTNKGEYNGAFAYKDATAVVIKDASGADVTANYDITPGTTTVGKLTIKATNVDGNNDGTADNLTDENGNTVTDNGKPVHVVDLTGSDGTNAPVYDDQDHKPTVKDNGYVNPISGEREPKTLVENTDYTVKYYEANPDGTPDMGKEITTDPAKVAGDKVAVVTFTGNYEGSLTVPVDVRKRPVTFTGKTVVAHFDTQAHSMADRIARILSGNIPYASITPDDATADEATRKMTYVVEGLVDTHTTKNSGGTDTVAYDIKDVELPSGTNGGYPIEAGVYEAEFQNADGIAIYRADGTTNVTANYDIKLTTGTYTVLQSELHNNGEGWGVIPPNPSETLTIASKVIHVYGKTLDGTADAAADVYDGTAKEPIVKDEQEDHSAITLEKGTGYDIAYYAPADVTFVRDDELGTDTKPLIKEGARQLTPEEAGEKIAVVTLKGNLAGTITAHMDVKQRPVSFTGKSDTKAYNGQKQSVTGYDASTGENEGLLTGEEFDHTTKNKNNNDVDSIEAIAEGTNASAMPYAGTITAADDVKVYDASGADVTRNYAITTAPGTLTIKTAKVTDGGNGNGVKADDDGNPIDANGNTTADPTKYVKVVDVRGKDGNDAPIYDGTPKTPEVYDYQNKDSEGNPKKLEEGKDYEVKYYKAEDIDENGKPKPGASETNPTDAGDKVAVVTLTGDYEGTVNTPADVRKRPAVFTGDSKSYSYDGKKHVIETLTVKDMELVEGHTYNIRYLAEGTEKGEYKGNFVKFNNRAEPTVIFDGDPTTDDPDISSNSIFDANGTDVTANYSISFALGTLSIGATKVSDNGNGEGVEVNDEGEPVVGPDGKPVVRVNVTVGYDDTKTPVYDGEDHTPTVHDVQGNKNLTEGTDYTVTYYEPQRNGDGTVKTDEKGRPIPNEDKPLSAADAGTGNDGDKVAVVEFIKDYTGEVTIGTNVLKRPVTFTGKSGEKSYTGTQQTIEGYDVNAGTNEGLLTAEKFGHNTEVGGKDTVVASASGTKLGSYEGTITAATGVTIMDKGGVDVTKNYAITTAPGTLTIKAAKVTDGGNGNGVKAGDDGNPIDENGNTTTDPTKYVKVVDVRGKDGDNAPYYDGTPKVPEVYDYQNKDSEGNPKKLEEGKDYTVTYYEANPDGTPDINKPTNPTDAGEKVAVVTLTGDYEGTVNVPMDVEKQPLHVTTGSATKEYDGTPLTNGDVALKGIVAGETVEVQVTGTQTEIGKSENGYSVIFADGEHVDYVATKSANSSSSAQSTTSEATTKPASNSVATQSANAEEPGLLQAMARVFAPKVAYADENKSLADPGKATAKSSNYTVNASEGAGTLEVTAISAGNKSGLPGEGKRIVVQPISTGDTKKTGPDSKTNDSGTYTGKPVNGPELYDTQTKDENGNPKKLVEGTDYTVTYYDEDGNPVDGKPTDAGKYRMVVTYQGMYSGTYEASVTIAKAKLTVTTPSAKKAYDGTALTTGSKDASIKGFVNNEKAPFSVTGSQTKVGSSKNTYKIDWESSEATAKQKNYQVSEKLGTLTVTAASNNPKNTSTTGTSTGVTTTRQATASTGDASMAVMPFLVSAAAAIVAGLRRRKK